jgi:hypothetical protein
VIRELATEDVIPKRALPVPLDSYSYRDRGLSQQEGCFLLEGSFSEDRRTSSQIARDHPGQALRVGCKQYSDDRPAKSRAQTRLPGEMGQSVPTLELLFKLKAYSGRSIDWIAMGEDEGPTRK